MSERYFRIIVGVWLITGLFLDSAPAIFVLLCLLLFEGITNLRVPVVVSRLRYGQQAPHAVETAPPPRFRFEAERALRLIVVFFVAVPMMQGLATVVPGLGPVTASIPLELLDWVWWLPWFVGFALVGAGLSGLCPMVMALRYIGLR